MTETNNTQKLIVIEGLDGSGKATQTQRLFDALHNCEIPVSKVSFPNYESPSSSLIKMYLGGDFGSHPEDVNAYAASSFYAVDRYASFKKDWFNAWNSGVIVADRYTTSNAIHQCSKLPHSEWDTYLEWLFRYEYELLGIPAPDLVLYLRVDPAVSQQLITDRYGGNEEKKDIHEKDVQYLARCREAADYCAEKLGWCVIDCTEDGRMKKIEDIHREVLSHVKETLT